jgi:hypothetical protein
MNPGPRLERGFRAVLLSVAGHQEVHGNSSGCSSLGPVTVFVRGRGVVADGTIIERLSGTRGRLVRLWPA